MRRSNIFVLLCSCFFVSGIFAQTTMDNSAPVTSTDTTVSTTTVAPTDTTVSTTPVAPTETTTTNSSTIAPASAMPAGTAQPSQVSGTVTPSPNIKCTAGTPNCVCPPNDKVNCSLMPVNTNGTVKNTTTPPSTTTFNNNLVTPEPTPPINSTVGTVPTNTSSVPSTPPAPISSPNGTTNPSSTVTGTSAGYPATVNTGGASVYPK